MSWKKNNNKKIKYQKNIMSYKKVKENQKKENEKKIECRWVQKNKNKKIKKNKIRVS